MLTTGEAFWFYSLTILIMIILIKNTLHKDFLVMWSPLSVVAIIYLYYCVIGPYITIQAGDTYYRLLDHRPYYEIGWKAGFLSLLSICVGFGIKDTKKASVHANTKVHHDLREKRFLLWLALIGSFLTFGLSGFGVLAGENLNITGLGGSFKNYIFYTVNIFIPVLALMFVEYLTNKRRLWVFLVLLIYVLTLFLALGFRYRLVMLVGSLFMIYYIHKRRKPQWIVLFFGLLVFVALMGFIEITRRLHGGLIIDESVVELGFADFLLIGMRESAVFQSTGLMLTAVPDYIPYQNFQFVLETLAMPIPRELWPGKPSGEELKLILQAYERQTGFEEAGIGAAILNFGEAFIAFGWGGLLIVSFIWGLIFRKAWNFFRSNANNIYAIVLFTLFNSFIYVIISRGYLPQIALNFFFTVYPMFWIWSKIRKRFARYQIRDEFKS
ncbi:MAG: O-antigen polymerase [Bacteroidota bacterium]